MDSVKFTFRNHRKEPSLLENEGDSDDDESLPMSDFDEHPWLTVITGIAQDKTSSKEIGRCVAHLINRPQIRSTFHSSMDEPSQELQSLGWTLFDKHGCFKSQWYQHPVLKGTGVFGEELSKGKLFDIEAVRVDKDRRRKGIGKSLVQGVIRLAAEDKCDLNFAWPTNMNTSDLRDETKGLTEQEKSDRYYAEEDAAISFFRSIGFRRVGRTKFFCLPNPTDHKAHQLQASDDVDRPKEPKSSMEDRRKQFPVHHTLMSFHVDEDGLQYLERLPPDVEFSSTDDVNCTPLHLAALRMFPKCLSYLLTKVDKLRVCQIRNIDGYTPLEVLLLKGNDDKEFAEGMLRPCSWKGFSPDFLECKRLLEEAVGLKTDKAQFKYGCTCGVCVEGVMSKRMTFELLCGAEWLYESLPDHVKDAWNMVNDDGSHDQLWIANDMAYVPLSLQELTKNHKTFKLGFAKVAEYIAICLRENKLPTVVNIRRAWDDNKDWPPNTQTYLNKGGKFEYVLDRILDTAQQQNFVHGDGNHWETFKDHIKKLPKCSVNDDNFDLIRSKVFDQASGATVVPNGPHYPAKYWDPKPITAERRAFIEQFEKDMQERIESVGGQEKYNEILAKVFGSDGDGPF